MNNNIVVELRKRSLSFTNSEHKMQHIHLQQGDITTAEVDAIVNAANPVMLGGGGVDGAIHQAAGPALLAACRAVPTVDGVRCPTGQARITTAGDLPARFVIHAVGPIYRNENNAAELLASAYRNALQLALDNQCNSVALPAISCGVYGYPISEAALISLNVCNETEFHRLDLTFYLFDQVIFRLWQDVYAGLVASRC